MIYVLDASAMIAYLRDEPGAEVVEQALLDSGSECCAHVLNLCEVFYDFHRAIGYDDAVAAVEDLERTGIMGRSEIDAAFWRAAGVLKATHRRVSLADCFAIALTRRLAGTLMTADHHELDLLAEQAVCTIRFIR